jgi:hypothetical protein
MKIYIRLLGALIIVIGMVYTFYIQFMNIDMTQTRLFITFWREWLVIFTIEILGSAIVVLSKDEK